MRFLLSILFLFSQLCLGWMENISEQFSPRLLAGCTPTSSQFKYLGVCTACDTSCLTCTQNVVDGLPCLTCKTSPTGQKVSATTKKCVDCTLSTVFVGTDSLCYTNIANCNTQTAPPLVCTDCAANYYIDASSTCTACVNPCLTCSSSTVCITCISDSYYLDASSACQACISPCSKCSIGDGTVCTDCVSGYYFNAGVCTSCQPDCLTCTYTTSIQCSTCSLGKYVDTNKVCQSCTSPCVGCNWDSGSSSIFCTSCINPTYYVNSSNNCVPCISPCVQCLVTNGNKCTLCIDTFYADATNTCQSCVSPCINCSGTTGSYCSSCIDTYYPDSGQCKSCVSPCKKCLNDTLCQSCVDKFYWDGITTCIACTAPCLTCSSSSLCLTCDNPNGMYLSGTTCLQCSSFCGTCPDNGTGSVCTTCASDRQFDANNNCICKDGKYDDGTNTCLSCPIECGTCGLGAGALPYCLTCADGYYSGTNNACFKCSSPCGKCTSLFDCVTCDVTTGRTMQNGVCKCGPGFFSDEYDSIQCITCNPPSCNKCTQANPTADIICSSCQAGLNRTFNSTTKQCPCDAGYFEDPNGGLPCVSCPTSCSICLASGNSYECTACVAGNNRVVKTGQCICDFLNGFYENGVDLCATCTTPCKTCHTTATTCDSCVDVLKKVVANACVCIDGYYSYLTTVCQKCADKCATCQNTLGGDICLTCSLGYYIDPNNANNCIICVAPCYECTAASLGTYCNSCLVTANMNASAGVCSCKPNYYINSTNGPTSCSQCVSPCYNCEDGVDGTVCKDCPVNSNRLFNSTSKTCPCLSNYYYMTGQTNCLQCASPCLTCSNDGTGVECLSCVTGTGLHWVLTGNQCLCDNGYFLNSGACNSCISPCLTCFTSGSTCQSCVLNLFRQLVVNACSCIPGYYDNGQLLCAKCDYTCKECSGSATTCTVCDALSFRTTLTSNACPCDNTYYDNQTSTQLCSSCTLPCFYCASNNDGTKCTQCVAGSQRAVVNNKCVCNNGFYDNSDNGVCPPCYFTCKTCSNNYSCLSCDTTINMVLVSFEKGNICVCTTGYYFDSTTQSCQKACPEDCQTCDASGNCLSCLSTRTLTNGRCLCTLNSGGYYCRTSCTQTHITKLMSLLRGTSNDLGTSITGLGFTVGQQQTDSINFNSYTSLAATLKLGYIIKNSNKVLFQNKRQLDFQIFGLYNYYDRFIKDNILYMVFQRDSNILSFDIYYDYSSSLTYQTLYQQTNTLAFSNWNNYHQLIKIDSFEVLLIISIQDSETVTINYDQQATYLKMTINIGNTNSFIKPAIITQIVLNQNTAVTNTQFDSIGLAISQLFDQAASYECHPHQKAIRQVIRENHQTIINLLPATLVAMQSDDGQNFITQAKSSTMFSSAGGVAITLNGANLNYFNSQYQQSNGNYQYSSVSFPDSLFFSIGFTNTYSLTSFKIQHNIASGYSIQQTALTYVTQIGTFTGLLVDLYGTTSVKTLIFSQTSTVNFVVTQNSNNIIITATNAKPSLYFYVFGTNDQLQLTSSYNQPLFNQLVNLVLNSIQYCSSNFTPLRYVKEYLKLNLATILPTVISITEPATSYYFQTGTAILSGQTAFTNSHIISTDINSNILFSNGFIKDGSLQFGTSTKYFTYVNKIFILGATLNGINFINLKLDNNLGGTPTCTNSQLLTNDGGQILTAYISDCRWSQHQIVNFYLVDLTSGLSLTQVVSTTSVNIKLQGLVNNQFIYLATLVQSVSSLITTQQIQLFLSNLGEQMSLSKQFIPCNIQCLTKDQNYNCKTFRSGYQSNQFIELAAPLQSDINNIGGKKCQYFSFNDAKTMIQSNKNAFDTYLKSKSTGLINSAVNNTFITVDRYSIGQITSNLKSTPPIASPQIGQTDITLITATYLGAQSQLYSYQLNSLYYVLMETNVDTVYINNILNIDNRGFLIFLQNTFNDYGLAYISQCSVFYNNTIYSNVQECIIRQLIPSFEGLTNTVTSPTKAVQYVITQTNNPVLIYTMVSTFGFPITNANMNDMAYKIYSDFINQNQESNCICWGRYRIQGQNCRCQSGYYPPSIPYTQYGIQDCLPCNFRCKTCQFQDTQCLSCPLASFRVLDTTAFTCACQSGYMETPNVVLCVACFYQCGECSGNINTCTQCGLNSFRTLSGSTCNCNNGYYDDGSSKACQQCHFSCTTCNGAGASACQTCSGTRYQSGTQCLCNPGTYENNVAACPACDYTCATCVTSATNCQTCSGGITRTQSVNTCPCSPNYYNILNQANCAACNQYCGSCTGNGVNQCINCPSLSNRSLVSGSCVCSNGFYQNVANSVVCPACDYSCLTCQINPTNCKSCDTTKKRTLDSSQNTCFCNDGFYDNGSAMCQSCDVSCLTCQGSATSCTKCPLNANRSYDSINKKCPCLPTFSDAGIVSCLKCANSCQGCFGTATFCTACNIVGTNRLDNSGTTNTCPCQNGYFDDGINMLCQSCSPSCQKCTSLNYCTACNVAMQRIDQSASGKCPCQNGFFDNTVNSMCQTCDYSCLTCVTTAKNCTSCSVGVNRIAGSTCPCDIGFFDNGVTTCVTCNIACQTCSGAANQCTSCPPTRAGNSCLCQLGYIDVGTKQCQACNYKCGSCAVGNLNVCLSCNVNRVLSPTCDCAEGFIEFNQICTTCPNQCGTCDDNKNCLSCRGDRINLPSCVCPQGYYEDGISPTCTICFSYCSQCTKTVCQACLGNRIIKNNACVCPTSSIQNQYTYLCSNCQNAVIQAAFSNDLSQIIITFPYTIQYPQTKTITSAQACTMIFTNATSNLLGQQPLCALQGTSISITLGLQSTITTNSTFTFNNGIVQQQGCTTTISQFLMTNFTYPATIPNPFFSLPQFQDPITLCQDITLNMLNIRNSGNRIFPIVQWTLVSMIPYDATVASYLQNLMTTSNSNVQQSLTIEKLQLSEYGSYTVQLKAFNFLNKSYSSQTTFQTQSKEAPIVQMDPNQQFVFGLWQDMAFTISFSHLSCTTGEVIQVYDALRINWTQIIIGNSSRLLEDTTTTTTTTNNQLLPTSQISETDGMTFLNTLTIPQYTATIGQDYTFVVSVSLTNKPIQQSIYFTASVISTPMQAYIDGGTRTQSIGAIAQINGFCRDPDQNFPWNTEPGITFSWQCINLVTGKACLDSVDQPLKLNITANNQSFLPRVLAPYQPLQFIMVNTKNAITLTTSVVILVIEMDLPVIGANYPSGYDSRQILLHEQLNFTISTTEDPDSLKYFCQILYNYNVVAVFRFQFLQVQFRIWDYFSDATQDVTQIQIKLAAQDLYHYLPSTVTMNFDINVPPTGCSFSISPLTGTSIVDLFTLSVSGCQDSDLPLSYQFHIYGGVDIMNDDIIKGESIRKITLYDPSSSPTLQTVLPSPSKLDGSQGDTLVIIASIYDNNNGLTNITKTVKLKSIVTKILSGVDFQSIIQQINRSLKLSTISTPLVTNLPSLFIASLELSTIYNILSGSPNKQAQMKPTLQNVYKYVNYFQGKLTSKFLQESLLSSLSNVGGTGVTFQVENSTDIDIYSVRQQILQVQKQLLTQITNLQYLLQQKAQSGGSSSQFEIQIKTIDNVILNQGLVTDSLFNAIKGTSFKNTSDADINLLKTQVQTLNGQISQTSLTRTLPNAKPMEYTGKEMSMTASKATPANIVSLLSSGSAPTLYSENDESTQATDLNGTVGANSNQIDEDEIDFAKYLLEHPDLNAIYGVPNKSSTRMLQETYDRVVDGVIKFKDYLFNRNNITYVRLLQQSDPAQVKQYSVQMSNYQTSPYMQDPAFKSSLVPNATTTVKDGQNVTVDNSIVSQYGTVSPSINVSQNGQNQQLNSLNGQQISLQFTSPKNASNGTLQCTQQGSQQWQTGTCKLRKSVNSAGQIVYACDCEVINPTTVLTTLNGLITNKLNSVFGADALSTFANIQFWKYAIFYIALIFTGVFITLMVIGQKKDNEDFMQEISKELEPIAQDMPELQELKREFNGLLLKTIKEDEEDKEFSIHSATELKNKVHDIKDNNDIQQLALGSLQQNHLVLKKEHGHINIMQQNVKSDRLEEQIKYNQQRLDMNQVKRELNQHDFLSQQKNRFQGRATNLREVVKNVYSISDLAYENGQNIKLKPFTIKLLCEGVMTLHRVLNILMLYDDIISRPARFALIYSKTILVLALSALFSGNFGPVYSVLMNIFVGQVINIILQIITVLMKASPILKLSGIIFTAVVSGVCWFIVLMLSAQMDQTAADAWAVQFLSAQVSDLVVIESIVCGIKLGLYPWIIKALHNPDNTGNSIAHLAFIAVAQPQIQKFYVVE